MLCIKVHHGTPLPHHQSLLVCFNQYPLGSNTLCLSTVHVCLLEEDQKRGLDYYLRVWLWLLVILGLLLWLKDVIYQLSDPTKGKPPVQISKV